MEAILELVVTTRVGIVNALEFKKSKTRTRVLTIIFTLVFAILLGLTVWGAVALFQQGSTVGAIVMGVIALAIIAVGLAVVIRDHKTHWEKY